MASEDEIKLGRLVVEWRLGTEEQLLTTLRERNEDPDGPSLGERLLAKGLIDEAKLEELREAVSQGAVKKYRPRHDMSTDHQISLADAREAVARECLEEAKAKLQDEREVAVRELRRLSEEFPDTESGNRAKGLLGELDGGDEQG